MLEHRQVFLSSCSAHVWTRKFRDARSLCHTTRAPQSASERMALGCFRVLITGRLHAVCNLVRAPAPLRADGRTGAQAHLHHGPGAHPHHLQQHGLLSARGAPRRCRRGPSALPLPGPPASRFVEVCGECGSWGGAVKALWRCAVLCGVCMLSVCERERVCWREKGQK